MGKREIVIKQRKKKKIEVFNYSDKQKLVRALGNALREALVLQALVPSG